MDLPCTYTLVERLNDKEYDDIVKLLEDHYYPKPSEIVQCYKFNTQHRCSEESIAVYVAEL